jgi:dimethylhistidine N-methyltransferase
VGIEQTETARLRWITFSPAEQTPAGEDVVIGLQQIPKALPCRYFYDDRGSELFEQICDLPEYYPTRTEEAILEAYATEMAALTGACELVELGSGSSRKTRLLLNAYSQLQSEVQYCPIDVSAGMLRMAALRLLLQYPRLRVCGLAGTYDQALAELPPRGMDNRMLIFLGSTLGNFDPSQCDRFLTQIQQALTPGEFFLLGVDLQKDPAIITAAYNDSQGVTAAFNRNILTHLNRRFGGDFVLEQFDHWAPYNAQAHQIEMYLRSRCAQTAVLTQLKAQVALEPEEVILTEISRKFHLPTLSNDLEAHALRPLATWTDPKSWFALLLCQRQCCGSDCP